VTLADGSTRAWSAARTGEDGTLAVEEMRGGYALFTIDSPTERIMLLNARGHGMVYVNGEPRCGDPYDLGFVSLPVKLLAGTNEFLFQCPRGGIKAELVEPRASMMLSMADMTLPDLVRGTDQERWSSIVAINATTAPLKALLIRFESHQGTQTQTTDTVGIPALSCRKIAFRIPRLPHDPNLEPKVQDGAVSVIYTLNGALETSSDARPHFKLVNPDELQNRTFISDIDGSVQYFAARPALKDDPANALILTLHGASVEGHGQAAAYASKDWVHIVAPTNRRPFGFDWEEWGRLDALEVLEIAKKELLHDSQRVYLTGHSMGGHGTWQIGTTFPGEFAAIAPSAGWISFESYAGGVASTQADADSVAAIIHRAGNASRTLQLQRNLDGVGVYILHGEKDDNVPVQQARTMREELGKWHSDFAYYERPGAGHWWGNECVDWPPLMQFLRERARPQAKDIHHVAFITASPGVSASRDWVTIEQQQKPMQFSRVDLRRDVAKRTISGVTENVARLAIDVSACEGDAEILLNIDTIEVRARAKPQAAGALVHLQREGDSWTVVDDDVAPSAKNPARCGPFKAAFNHRMMFVFGTAGTAEENAWAFAKARFDAETFWYRGNGSIDVIADREFDASDAQHRDRSVILYGNAETNSAWDALLADSPVQIRRDSIKIGERAITGDDLACLFIRTRSGSSVASVGVVSGTGIVGMRVTDRLPYFVSGVAYPDCTVISAGALREGDKGIKVAGFFGNDWSVNAGEFAWRDEQAEANSEE
jgi:dienelactone hydrolase